MRHPAETAIRSVTAAFCALLLAVFFVHPVAAEAAKPLKGIALIIGQSRYDHITPLANPVNDARAINGLLTSLGFDTRSVSDQDTASLKRDLQRFAEDAAGADVALLYYSGHGIEAGGENYLVPTDADPSALDDAGARLVPLSAIMDKLKQSVPVTIFLLDACRTNPFPAGATLRVNAKDQPASVAAIGLGAPRGMSIVEDQPKASDNLGMVIGLAAEPGSAALDGAPGQNSPYAAALLRHFAALKGEEFGTVMRMVTEEVYLSTKTRQRPWINESLRRLLYFGGTVQEATGDSGQITKERRQLLLTIADLPTAERKQVETIAERDGVSLDALYGVLRALGLNDIPKNPTELDTYLRAQTALLKQAALNDTQPANPEVRRFVGLAEQAIQQGAFGSARSFLSKAVGLIESDRRSSQIAQTSDESRIGDALVYEKRAKAARLASDFAAAARDYDSAFALVTGLNERWAWYYKFENGIALSEQGDNFGDAAATTKAVETLKAALTLIDREKAPEDWGTTQANLGIALQTQGDRQADLGSLEQSVAAFRLAVQAFSDSKSSANWSQAQTNLGNSLVLLAQRQTGSDMLREAVLAFDAGLKFLPRGAAPLEWARTQNNFGNALRLLGERENRTEYFQQALVAYHKALLEQNRDEVPLQWAVTQSNIGITLRDIGERESGTGMLLESAAAYRLALEELTPKLAPVDWSMAQNNLGNVLATIGQREGDIDQIKQAVIAFRAALQERRRKDVPVLWAQTQNNLGSALALIGQTENDATALEQAAAALRAVLEVRTRESMPYQWALTQSNLGSILQMLGEQTRDRKILGQAVKAHQAALQEFPRDRAPQEWSKVQNNLGNALRSLGELEQGTATLNQALAALTASLEERSREQSPLQWARTEVNIGLTSLTLAQRGGGRKAAAQAVEAFEAALDVYREANAGQNIAQVERFLAEAQALRR